MILRDIFKYMAAVALIGFVSSCELEETNVDPDNPADADVDLILPAAQAGFAYVQGGDLGRYSNVLTQHLAGVGRQHLVIGRYQINETDVNNLWRFSLYPIMENTTLVIDKATEEGSPHYSGVAKIMLANIIGVTTDAWGDVPFSQAFQGDENFNPVYDPQEQIYTNIQTLLDEGIAELQATESFQSPGGDDLVYGGDLSKWIKAAYTLKARYYNHLSQVDPQQSAQQALTALQNGFTSNADDALFQFGASETEANPYYQFNDQRGDVVMGEFFVELLKSLNDPRLPAFVAPLDTDDEGNPVYEGATAGVAEDGSPMGPYYASIDSPVPIITYYEAKFIEAEANLRMGNSEAAATAYNEAVRAALVSITGTADAAYIAQNASATAGTISLEQIMTQKYIAMFTNIEAWVDYRRTGLPEIPPAQNALGPFPLRFPYPQSERLLNAANIPAGGVGIGDPVWWDK